MKFRINPAVVVVLVILVFWQSAGAWSEFVREVLGTPSVIAVDLVTILAMSTTWFHIGVTAFELACGLVLAIVIGLALSLGLGTEEYAYHVMEPLLIVGNTVPKVILLPAFLMLLGVGSMSKIGFGALHGMLPIAIIVSNGARKISASNQVRAAQVMNATKPQLVFHILFPSILPYLISALRLAVSLTLLGVVLGEMYVARAGLGYLLMRWYGQMEISKMMSVVVLIGCLASILDFAFRRLEKYVWSRHGFRQST